MNTDNATPRLAVIILNWNGRKLLEQFLPVAVKYTSGPEVELVVADNGSEDDSVEWIRRECPSVRILEFGKNLGFAAGYNRALRDTGREYSLLLNSDVEVTEGWWQPLLAFMEADSRVGACQPKILGWRDRSRFEYAGAAGGMLDALGYPFCRGRMFGYVEEDRGQYDAEAVKVAWASGAALMVRTEAYFQVGGLDEDFFAHMEEIDLCCRMAGAGWGVYAVPFSKVYHVGGASLQQGDPKKTYLNFRNNLLLLHKNLPRKRGRRVLFVRRLADTLAWGMYMLKGDFPNANAILKAHRDFRKMRANYSDFPEKDYLRTLPGADRHIIIDHFLLRRNS